jgi:Gram-negative bacterial TonB protein C-terminal
MSHILVSTLLMAAQVTSSPVSAPPVAGVAPPPFGLSVVSPVEPQNCALEVRDASDAADAPPTRIQYFESGEIRITRPLAEAESGRPTADALIQLDDGWYAQGRPGLYRIGSPDNDPAKVSAPYLGMTLESGFADFVSNAKIMQFWDDTVKRERFDLSAVSRATMDVWTDCIKNLATKPVNASDTYPYYPSHYRLQKSLQPVTPINKHGWITSDDYPSRAMRDALQGTVAYTLTVGVNGRVQTCDMTKNENPTIMTSVNDVPELNQATCRNITRRARFIPATDAAGRPLVANYFGRVRWAIPYDPPPPPPPPLPKRF